MIRRGAILKESILEEGRESWNKLVDVPKCIEDWTEFQHV